MGRTARSADEGGAASVVVCALLGVLLLVGAALGVVAAAFVDHRRAQAAADLAAVSGATAIQRGGDGCGEAGRVARGNGAVMVGCTVEGHDVRVRVEVSGPGWLGWRGDLLGEARAGPAGVP